MTEDEKQQQADPIAWIDELAARARVMEIPEGWAEPAKAVLALPTLYMVGGREEPGVPLYLELDDGRALGVFTTRERAAQFALTNNLQVEGVPSVIEVAAPAALAHLRRTMVLGAPYVVFDAGSTQWGYNAEGLVALAREQGRLPAPAPRAEIERRFRSYSRSPNRATDEGLWGAVFGLAEWRFITRGAPPEIHPYTTMIEGTPYVLAFTDEELARQFAVRNRLEREKGVGTTFALSVDRSVLALTELHRLGVHSVVFNPDVHGFFAPLANVERMFHFFMARG